MTTFAVSKVRLDVDGRITNVLWGEVDVRMNAWAAPEVVVPERQFMVADYDGSRKTIVLMGPTAYEREVHDMDRLPNT